MVRAILEGRKTQTRCGITHHVDGLCGSWLSAMLGRRTAAYWLRNYADNPRKEKEGAVYKPNTQAVLFNRLQMQEKPVFNNT